MEKQSKKTRIAIIGAGVVGLYLAWRLADEKRDVVVFERNSRIGEKPCSCIVSQRLERFLSKETIPQEHVVKYFLVHFPHKVVNLNLKSAHLIINRTELDKGLAELASNKGVVINLDTAVSEKPAGFDKVIACDGALSTLRKKMGVRAPSYRNGIFLRVGKKDYSDKVETWPIKTGFLWKVPRGESVEYGGIGKPKEIKKSFPVFLEKQGVGYNQEDLKAHLIPEGPVFSRDNDIALCGDSAGLTKPWSGGGIIWGLTAADILIKHFPDFQKYRRETAGIFRPKIRKGKCYRWLVYQIGRYGSFFLPREVNWNNDFIN